MPDQPLTSTSDGIGDIAAAKGRMLREAWYYALPSHDLARRRMVHRTLLGEPVLIGRGVDGTVFALRDTCPHRGTLLSRGSFDGREVQCSYHGWRFGTDGQCTAIPSQAPHQRPQPADIRAQRYPAAEAQGNIWVFVGSRTGALPPVPQVPSLGNRFQLHVVQRFACNVDIAAVGLMDPAHGAFVHRSRLWRDAGSIHEKQKRFAPVEGQLGWRMERHEASRNSRAYRLFLGGAPATEITYLMPSVRIEHAATARYGYCGLTACTPVDENTTDVHHVMYWNIPGGALWRPLVRPIAERFLGQDRRAVMAMVEGQGFNPSTMLIQDADTQTRWYYRLKAEWLAAQAEGRAPRNPLAPVVLTWRS